ncbi:MAG: bifunctional UDP-sugar hydrolase/5'-nucleotidase [Calditrichia bacterium]
MKKFIVLVIFICSSLLLAQENSQTMTLHVFFTNDVHGHITEQSAEFLNPEFPPLLGGGAAAYAIIKDVREQIAETQDASLLLDAGDIFQGTLVGTRSQGEVVVEYMNRVGYDAVAPGNHDFDLGRDNLEKLIKESDFPWISCNIIDKETGKVWSMLKPYMVKNINGIKIGFTGATTVGTEYMSFVENVRGLNFVPEIPALQKAVDHLRDVEKVDLVIAQVHTGLPYDTKEGYENLLNTTYKELIDRGYADAMEIAHYVRGIDLLLGGHLHRGYQKPWVDPVNHTIAVQNYGNGGNLGWIKLNIDRRSGAIMGYDLPSGEGMLLLLQSDEFRPDSTILAYIREQQKEYESGFDEVIGTSENSLTRAGIHESPMYNLVTDAMRTELKADFAFTNYGGIRADIKAGPISREDIFKVLPFGNQLVEFKVTGEFLKEIIEQKIRGNGRGMAISGGKIVYNKNLPNGERVVSFTIDGEPLQADKLYRVVTTDYLMEGNSGLSILEKIPQEKVAYTGLLTRNAMMEYIRKNSPLNVGLSGRWTKKDNAQPDPDWIKQFRQPQASAR